MPVSSARPSPVIGTARVSSIWHLPDVLHEFGVDPQDVLEDCGIRPDIFEDRENRIGYLELGRLLRVCEERSNCEHIALLIGQRTRLADLGLAGQIAVCSETAGQGVQRFADHLNLQSSAATISVITADGFTRIVYAISEHGMSDTRGLQLGAVAVAFNVLQDLCGRRWLPTVVTFASRSPANLRPCQALFRAPLRFDSEESALVFESHWLDRTLPAVDPAFRRQVEDAVRARQTLLLDDFPATVRRLLRKQLLLGDCSMDEVAALLRMHRRTLDRWLLRHGIRYGELLESVQNDVATQLLRDTGIQVRQIAEALHFSSAANFATAFRRWTGMTPTEYRRRAG